MSALFSLLNGQVHLQNRFRRNRARYTQIDDPNIFNRRNFTHDERRRLLTNCSRTNHSLKLEYDVNEYKRIALEKQSVSYAYIVTLRRRLAAVPFVATNDEQNLLATSDDFYEWTSSCNGSKCTHWLAPLAERYIIER